MDRPGALKDQVAAVVQTPYLTEEAQGAYIPYPVPAEPTTSFSRLSTAVTPGGYFSTHSFLTHTISQTFA